MANTHKPKSDAWSAPERVANPMATYFPDTPEGNVSKTRVAKIKFNHHATKDGSCDRDFAQSSICLPFQVAGYCPRGTHSTENHHSRAAMLRKKNGAHAEEVKKKKVDQLDALFVALFC